MSRFIRMLCLALALIMMQGLALAAPSRDIAFIDMDEEELERLRDHLGPAAIEAFRAAHPDAALDPEQDGLGLHIYALREQDGLISLEGDLYQVAGMQVSPTDAPEDSVRWLCHYSAQLRRDQAAPGGAMLLDQQLSAPYAAKGFYAFSNEAAGFELLLPDSLTAPTDAQADPLVFASADGRARLTLSLLPLDGSSAENEQQRLAAAHPGLSFLQAEPYGPGLEGLMLGYRVIQVYGEALVYSLELSYPPELEAEYSLYFQFIRNSFVVSEVAVG